MGNSDRYEKLVMLGGIDEKYIREADKYLVKPLAAGIGADITSDSAISLSPQARKFSWKSFAVIAACAAVLIGGTVILANYLNGRTTTPPILDTSDSYNESNSESRNESYNESDTSHENSDPVITINDEDFLNDMRKLFGAQGDIAYARDRLNIRTYKLPENIKGLEFDSEVLGYKNGRSPVVADKDHVIFIRETADGQEELAEYGLNSGVYTSLHSIADDPTALSGDVLDIQDICYADSSYVVIRCAIYSGATMTKTELRVVERKPENGAYPWHTAYDLSAPLMVKKSIIIGDDVYFTAYDPVTRDEYDNAPIMRYNIKNGGAAVQVAEGVDLYSYNGELYYHKTIDVEDSIAPDRPLYRLGGELPYDTDKYSNKSYTIGKNGIFNPYASHDGIIRNYITDNVIVSGSLSYIDASAYDFLIRLDADGYSAYYNTNTDELLVLELDDPLSTPYYEMSPYAFDGGVYGVMRDDESGTLTLYVVSEKPADTRIEQFRNDYDVSDNIPVSLFENGWELQKFELGKHDETDGMTVALTQRRLENGTAFLNERTMLTVRTREDGSPEIAAYDLFDKTFITLFGKDDETLTVPDEASLEYYLAYSDKNIVIFEARVIKDRELLNSEIRVIDVSNNSKFKVPVSGTLKTFDFTICVENNKLYFIIANSDKEQFGYNGTLYSYDLSLKGAGSAEHVRDNVYNIYFTKGEIITSTLVGQTAVQEIDGTEVFHLPGGDYLSSGYSYPNTKDIFVIRNGGVFISDHYTLTNISTGEKLFRVPVTMSGSVLSDSCVMFEHEMVFDAKNNKLYDLKDHSRTIDLGSITEAGAVWYKCGEGFCTFDVTSKGGYIIKRRGVKTDKLPDPAQTSEQPLTDIRSYDICAPNAEHIAESIGTQEFSGVNVHIDPNTVIPLYEADIFRYAESGVFEIQPDTYAGKQRYVCDMLDENGEFAGRMWIKSDGTAAEMSQSLHVAASDKAWYSVSFAPNARRIAAVMEKRGIAPMVKEVKAANIDYLGYVYYIDCGDAQYLALTNLEPGKGNGGLFNADNEGFVEIGEELKEFTKVATRTPENYYMVDITPYL